MKAIIDDSSIKGFRLDASGIVAIADIQTIAYRTVLTGSASFLDVLFLAPGIHRHQDSSEVNKGEYPSTGAMTTGYVFRIENQAMVGFLQRIGETGKLVTVEVSTPSNKYRSVFALGIMPSALFLLGIVLTILVAILYGLAHDWWGLGVMGMLMLARLINVVVIKRRTQDATWKGALEPGVHGDLLILLSQDRWIRMRGLVDDLKAVTSGQWLRDVTKMESFCASFATLLVFLSATLAGNISTFGGILLAGLLLVSAALLGLCNAFTRNLHMFGRKISQVGPPKSYERRLQMANELIVESGRNDWAIAMGLIVPKDAQVQKVTL